MRHFIDPYDGTGKWQNQDRKNWNDKKLGHVHASGVFRFYIIKKGIARARAFFNKPAVVFTGNCRISHQAMAALDDSDIPVLTAQSRVMNLVVKTGNAVPMTKIKEVIFVRIHNDRRDPADLDSYGDRSYDIASFMPSWSLDDLLGLWGGIFPEDEPHFSSWHPKEKKWPGDTCQTISSNHLLRFEDLRSLLNPN